MFQWNDSMRKVIETLTREQEVQCHKMIEYGCQYLMKIDFAKPRSWSFAQTHATEIENYIMEKCITGSYNSKMLEVAANHAAFIADYGWDRYCREMRKPESGGSVKEFFYDASFDDYDPLKVEIPEVIKKVHDFEDVEGDEEEPEEPILGMTDEDIRHNEQLGNFHDKI